MGFRSDLAGKAKGRTSCCTFVRTSLSYIRRKRRINGHRGPQAAERGPECTFSAFVDLRASVAPHWQFLGSWDKPSVPIPAFPAPMGAAAVPLRRQLRSARRITGRGWRQPGRDGFLLPMDLGWEAFGERRGSRAARRMGCDPMGRSLQHTQVQIGRQRPHDQTRRVAPADPGPRNWGFTAGRRRRARARGRHLTGVTVSVVVPMGPQATGMRS